MILSSRVVDVTGAPEQTVVEIPADLPRPIEAFVKGGYDHYNGSDIFGYEDDMWFIPFDNTLCPRYWYVGGGVHYFPLRESRDLRLHAVAAYNNFANSVSFSIGATYHFNLTQTILNNRKK
jgi:hypothetical protein